MLTIDHYFMGRRAQHPLALTPDIERNAARLVVIVNKLLEHLQTYGVAVPANPTTHTQVNSGWRPPSVNAATKGAAVNSKHMTGQAVDLHDPAGELGEFLLGGIGMAALEALGLWMEHPSKTPGWCHLQIVPPGSGRRVFMP